MVHQECAADPLPLRRAQKVMVRVAADVAPSISRGVRLHSAIRHCSLLARSSDNCTAAMKALATGATSIVARAPFVAEFSTALTPYQVVSARAGSSLQPRTNPRRWRSRPSHRCSHADALAPQQISISTMNMSALGGKADIPDTPHQCPLMTQSGHSSVISLTGTRGRTLRRPNPQTRSGFLCRTAVVGLAFQISRIRKTPRPSSAAG